MIGTFIVLTTRLAQYGAVVAGTRMAVNVAGKALDRFELTRSYAPTVAGFGDTIANVLDPLDITGHRKKKEQERLTQLQKAQTSAKEKEKLRKDEVKKRKAAEKKAKELEKKLKQARAEAEAFEKKAEKAIKAGKDKEAEFYKKQAQSSERWARTAQATAARAGQKNSADQQVALLQAAVEMAKQAANPPMSAVEAITRQASEGGRYVAQTLTDAINRDEEPDYSALAEGLDSGDPESFDDLLDVALSGLDSEEESMSFWGQETGGVDEEATAGPCCASCAATGSSCASGGCGGSAPLDMVDGSATGASVEPTTDRDVWEVDGPDEDEVSGGPLADWMLSGDDDEYSSFL